MFLSERPNYSALLSSGRHFFFSSFGVSETRNLSYGSHERQKLDLYEPQEPNDAKKAVVFIHGGGWETGSKNLHRFIGRSWAQRDCVVAIPNYRLAPDFNYPDQMEDVSGSISWLRNNHEGFDGEIFLAGHSAGAHLASLVGFSREWRGEAGLRSDEIQALVLLAGVYQFYPYNRADKRVKRFIGGERLWEEAQPVNHIDNDSPSAFLVHGERDEEVLPEQSVQLSKKLSGLGIKNELVLEEPVGHLELLLMTANGSEKFWTRLSDFIERVE
jgi:acetyl esterase/lipase